MEGGAQEPEHFFFYAGEAFAFSHEAIDGFGQGLHQVEVAQFVVSHQVEDAGITLEVVAEVHLVVDDTLQVVDAGIVISAAEIKRGYFIIEDEDTVSVDEQVVFGQLLFDIRNQFDPFFEGAHHKDLVDLRGGDIDKGLDTEVIIFSYAIALGEGFEFLKDDIELAVVVQVEVGVEQVMKGLYIMSCLDADHQGLFFEQVEPFLGIAVIHQEVLADEGVPVIALVEVEAFIEACLFPGVGRKLFPEVFSYEGFVLFVSGVAIVDIPAIDEQGQVGKPGDHIYAVDDGAGFG